MIEKEDDKLINETVDEELLKRFFAHSSCMQVPDDGFSRRVMRRLPRRVALRQRVAYVVWTVLCIAACVVVFFVSDGPLLFSNGLQSAFGGMTASLSHYFAHFNLAQLLPSSQLVKAPWGTPLLIYLMLSVLSCVGLYSLSESD